MTQFYPTLRDGGFPVPQPLLGERCQLAPLPPAPQRLMPSAPAIPANTLCSCVRFLSGVGFYMASCFMLHELLGVRFTLFCQPGLLEARRGGSSNPCVKNLRERGSCPKTHHIFVGEQELEKCRKPQAKDRKQRGPNVLEKTGQHRREPEALLEGRVQDLSPVKPFQATNTSAGKAQKDAAVSCGGTHSKSAVDTQRTTARQRVKLRLQR